MSVYKKNTSGRYYVRVRVPEHGVKDFLIPLDRNVRNASGKAKPLRKWLEKATPGPSAGTAGPSADTAGPSAGTAGPASPNKIGFTKTHYETPTSKLPIYKKNSSGRFHVYVKGNKKPFQAFSMEKHVRNTRTGVVKSLRNHAKGAPTTASTPEYVFTPYSTTNGHPIFKKGSAYYFIHIGKYSRFAQHREAVNASGLKQSLADHLKGKRPSHSSAPPPPRAAPVNVNYNAIYKRNIERSSLAKIRRYAQNWLGKTIPPNAPYKRIAFIIHPNKGNRTNAVNQAKRTTLFKYLSQFK
jgi:hypothetical protein